MMYVLFCRRALSHVLEGVTSKKFSGGKPPDPQFPPVPFYKCSFMAIAYDLLLSPSNYKVCRLDDPADAVN